MVYHWIDFNGSASVGQTRLGSEVGARKPWVLGLVDHPGADVESFRGHTTNLFPLSDIDKGGIAPGAPSPSRPRRRMVESASVAAGLVDPVCLGVSRG